MTLTAALERSAWPLIAADQVANTSGHGKCPAGGQLTTSGGVPGASPPPITSSALVLSVEPVPNIAPPGSSTQRRWPSESTPESSM